MADPQALLDAMVRDFCKVGPIPKSRARRRILEYAEVLNEASDMELRRISAENSLNKTRAKDYSLQADEAESALKAAEARNEALLQALKEFLENDGGEGSKCYDASKYVAARGKLRALLDSGSASQEAKTPGGENADRIR